MREKERKRTAWEMWKKGRERYYESSCHIWDFKRLDIMYKNEFPQITSILVLFQLSYNSIERGKLFSQPLNLYHWFSPFIPCMASGLLARGTWGKVPPLIWDPECSKFALFSTYTKLLPLCSNGLIKIFKVVSSPFQNPSYAPVWPLDFYLLYECMSFFFK